MQPMPSVHGPIRRLVNIAALAGVVMAAPTAAHADALRLLALGDSLTAGYGLADAETFTVQLEAALLAQGYDIQVINGGVSGDTSAGGLARLDWALADQPDLALVELGANDGLRGIDPAETRDNLAQILERLQSEGIPTLLAGMMAPPNLGQEYGATFNAIYPELAEQHDVPLYPFFLDGVATDPALNQDDGIHPNARGVAVIVEQLVPHIVKLIEDAGLQQAAEAG